MLSFLPSSFLLARSSGDGAETIIIVILLILFVAIPVIASKLDSQSSKTGSANAGSADGFCVRISKKSVNIPALPGPIDVFAIEGNGTIALSACSLEKKLRFRFRLFAEKAGCSRQPVLTMLNGHGFKEGPCSYEETLTMPYRVSSMNSFTPFVRIPVPALLFPYSGTQTLVFKIELQETEMFAARTGFSYSKEISVAYYNDDEGYVEIRETLHAQEESLQLANVKLAVLVSRADGHPDECEAAKIKSFVLGILGKNADAARKRKFNEAIAECFRVPTDQIPRKITEYCREVNDAPLSDRLNLLNLLFEVVMSDGSIAGTELDMLEKIATALHLDHEEYMKRRNKALPISAYEKTISGAQTDRILGISADMDDEEIRAHLSKMYREWNAKTSVKDEKIRAQAKEMIKLISKKRAELSAKR